MGREDALAAILPWWRLIWRANGRLTKSRAPVFGRKWDQPEN
jgi:hypothetical protein